MRVLWREGNNRDLQHLFQKFQGRKVEGEDMARARNPNLKSNCLQIIVKALVLKQRDESERVLYLCKFLPTDFFRKKRKKFAERIYRVGWITFSFLVYSKPNEHSVFNIYLHLFTIIYIYLYYFIYICCHCFS